jgi:hypothetical protein
MFILRAETIMAGCLLRSPALASVRIPLTFALMLAANIFADKANAAELTGYYLAGALASRHAAAFRLRTSMVLAVSVLLLLCFAVLHACGTYASFYLFPLRPLSSDTHLSLFFWRQLQAYAFIIPAILLSGRFLNSPANRFSRQTLGIYIVHETIMTVALRPFVLIHDAGLWSWPVFMLMSVALLSVTFFIVHLSSKSRVMRVAVLGKWKSD